MKKLSEEVEGLLILSHNWKFYAAKWLIFEVLMNDYIIFNCKD